jgi:uncharacterized protein YbjT (DUF2867 family)
MVGSAGQGSSAPHDNIAEVVISSAWRPHIALPAHRSKELSMSQETILLTGAAGGIGSTARTAAAILLAKGHRVRALVRQIDARAQALRELGAEIAVADMLDIVAVRAAMQGCQVVYFTMSISPDYLEAATNLAVTARSLGVKAFVNLSQMTLSQMSESATTSSPQQRQHWLAEQMLRWSGLPVVYLRPTAFLDGMFLAQAAKGIREESTIRLPFGNGKTSPIAGSDVGAAAAAVLADPLPHIGRVYELTGRQSSTMNDIAAAFSSALGRPIRYQDVPQAAFEARLRESGMPGHLRAHLVTMAQLHRDNRYDRLNHTFEELVKRSPLSVGDFARLHADVFSPSHS